MKQADE
jgi:hypothetical protein